MLPKCDEELQAGRGYKLMRVGFLKRDQDERRTFKRIWWGPAWRVVDVAGKDLFQPWCRTKGEARRTCEFLNIQLWEGDE